MHIQGGIHLHSVFDYSNYQHLAVLTSAEIPRKTQGPLRLAASQSIQIAHNVQVLGFPSCSFSLETSHLCLF